MAINKKTSITLLILAAAALLLVFLVINQIFRQIKAGSDKIIIQKNKIAEFEAKIKNIDDFKAGFKQFQSNLEKIDQLFIDISEPIEFIEFLESEASASRLSIDIAPPVAKKKNGYPWASLGFRLDLKGSSSDFLRFLERLEASSYLIEPMDLSIRKLPDVKNTVSASLSIKVYAK